jgi:hypothetical protein
MNVLDKLIRNGREQTRRRSYILLYLLFVMFLICGVVSETAHAQTTYPFLLLDFSNNNSAALTEPGFTSFMIGDSGSIIDGIKVEFAAITGSIDARLRGAPTGIPYELIYRDFVFTRPGGMRITLSGLEANETYQITIYAYDTLSTAGGPRIADWTANGEFLLTAGFDAGIAPVNADDYASSGMAQSDPNGTIILEAGPNENTTEQSGASNPYAFLNALVVSSMTPVNIARRPVPEDGAIITTKEIVLQWTPGNTSVSSNVYVGESFEDVNNATTADTDIFRGNSVEVSFPIGSAGQPYPDGLTEETTYYWRIDEVEESGTANKGNVWSFTVAPKTAFMPIPVEESLFIDPNLTLRWTSGAGAIEHHVYFGDNLDDVQAGTGGTDKGTVTDPNFAPGLLERNKTYYWRIDETDGTDTYTGDVWSFTTTLEGLGTVVMDVWEGIAGSTLMDLTGDVSYPDNPTRSEELTAFDTGDSAIGADYGARIYGWLYVPMTGDYTFYFTSADEGELWLSTDDDPANVQLLAHEPVWGSYNTFSHITDPVSLVAGEKYYIMAVWKQGGDWEHCQAAWKGPAIREREVIQGSFLSPFEPVNAYGPSPANGSSDVVIDSVLSWKLGKFAATSDVYFGSDFNDVNSVDVSNLSEYPNVNYANVNGNTYNPGLLDFNTNYYWRVDMVNNVDPEGLWKGNVWSFTTGDYVVIDDFESYNDINEGEEGSKRIYLVWSDGYANPNTNGSTIGYPDPDFANNEHFVEADIVHGGNQSGPLLYNNTTASYSEVTLLTSATTLGSDWTQRGLNTLSIWFYGDPNNTAGTEQLYIKLNSSRLLVSGVDITLAEWQNVEIPLEDFGIGLTNVSQIVIGLERTGAIGSEGILFMDDIRLRYIEQ